MYSGTTLRTKSGSIMGVHQKINRVARRHLKLLPGDDTKFPKIREIIHFEGGNGPDGLKRKSPSVDEPWHYINPADSSDNELINMVMDHYHNLVAALKIGNIERAAFESAWMSHAMTDGMTPPHHYPLSEKIEELWGKPKEERQSVLDKNVIRGYGIKGNVSRNWQYWGAKGVFITHGFFEFGVATAVKSARFTDTLPSHRWLKHADQKGVEQVFKDAVLEIYNMDLYHQYWRDGWTPRMARLTRQKLMPVIIRTVTYAWYAALRESQR